MTHPTISPKAIAGSLVLAVSTLCLGFYLSIRMAQAGQEEVGMYLYRIFYVLALVVVLKATFSLGRARGYLVGQADGTIHLGNLLRNLVASVIAVGCFVLLAGPFMMAIAQAARR